MYTHASTYFAWMQVLRETTAILNADTSISTSVAVIGLYAGFCWTYENSALSYFTLRQSKKFEQS